MVVAADHIPQSTQPLFNTLDLDCIGKCVSKVCEFLVGGGGGDEEAFSVTSCQSANDSCTGDGTVCNGD
jgi:hypothetical protein